MDLALDLDPNSPNYGDLLVVDGDLVLVTGAEEIRQNIVQRLRVFLGEWFLDINDGIPFFQQILVKNPDQGKIDDLLINRVTGTPGVVQLLDFAFKALPNSRGLSIERLKVQTTHGVVDYSGTVLA